jgi:acylphosphatase
MLGVPMERRAITVRGIVQGVGFRPFVYNLAARLQLAGFVRNQTGSVQIEVEGEPAALDHFMAELAGRPPALAQINEVHWESCRLQGERRFRIETSEAGTAAPIFISPDVATCADCLAELFDPADRRFGYPFLNCTNCGPRLTIITGPSPCARPVVRSMTIPATGASTRSQRHALLAARACKRWTTRGSPSKPMIRLPISPRHCGAARSAR